MSPCYAKISFLPKCKPVQHFPTIIVCVVFINYDILTQVKSGGHEEVAEAPKSDIKYTSLTGLFNKGTLLLTVLCMPCR